MALSARGVARLQRNRVPLKTDRSSRRSQASFTPDALRCGTARHRAATQWRNGVLSAQVQKQ